MSTKESGAEKTFEIQIHSNRNIKITVMDTTVDLRTQTVYLMKVGYLKYNGLLDSIITNNGCANEFNGELRIYLFFYSKL